MLLSTATVTQHGKWTYESRAVEHAEGTLAKGDLAQLISLFEAVDWDAEVRSAPVSADDRLLLRLELTEANGKQRFYDSSEAMNHRSWQFRDLVHFLRHNVATAGDPAGPVFDSARADDATIHEGDRA